MSISAFTSRPPELRPKGIVQSANACAALESKVQTVFRQDAGTLFRCSPNQQIAFLEASKSSSNLKKKCELMCQISETCADVNLLECQKFDTAALETRLTDLEDEIAGLENKIRFMETQTKAQSLFHHVLCNSNNDLIMNASQRILQSLRDSHQKMTQLYCDSLPEFPPEKDVVSSKESSVGTSENSSTEDLVPSEDSTAGTPENSSLVGEPETVGAFTSSEEVQVLEDFFGIKVGRDFSLPEGTACERSGDQLTIRLPKSINQVQIDQDKELDQETFKRLNCSKDSPPNPKLKDLKRFGDIGPKVWSKIQGQWELSDTFVIKKTKGKFEFIEGNKGHLKLKAIALNNPGKADVTVQSGWVSMTSPYLVNTFLELLTYLTSSPKKRLGSDR